MYAQNSLTARAAAVMGQLQLPHWNALRYLANGQGAAPDQAVCNALADFGLVEVEGVIVRLTELGYEVAFQAGFLVTYTYYALVLQEQAQRKRMEDPQERELSRLTARVKLAIEAGAYPPATTLEGEEIPKVYGRLFLRDGVAHLVQDGFLYLLNEETVRAWAWRFKVPLMSSPEDPDV